MQPSTADVMATQKFIIAGRLNQVEVLDHVIVSDNSYYILYNAKVPSIMIECGFMSNYEENEKLKNTSYQNDIAFAIMIGYNEFLGC